jgi:hypothetical protein
MGPKTGPVVSQQLELKVGIWKPVTSFREHQLKGVSVDISGYSMSLVLDGRHYPRTRV